MKNFLSTICIFAAMLLSNNATGQQSKGVQKVIIKTSIACDHCKACPSCGGLLQKYLLKQKGIQMITLNEDKKTIEVIFNAKKTDLPAIKTAISKLGYDADEIKADPLAVEKLDDCCKA
ncbi:MAG: cation transporter [Flavobacterium sp.]|nr:cation transporter [Flavobacterium sp.]